MARAVTIYYTTRLSYELHIQIKDGQRLRGGLRGGTIILVFIRLFIVDNPNFAFAY